MLISMSREIEIAPHDGSEALDCRGSLYAWLHYASATSRRQSRRAAALPRVVTCAPARSSRRYSYREFGVVAVRVVRCVAMRVLVTGHHGYIGSILVPLLTRAGHEVIGLDTYL